MQVQLLLGTLNMARSSTPCKSPAGVLDSMAVFGTARRGLIALNAGWSKTLTETSIRASCEVRWTKISYAFSYRLSKR